MPHCVIVVHIDSLMTSQNCVDILMISQSFVVMFLESGMGPMHPNDVSCWYMCPNGIPYWYRNPNQCFKTLI